MSEESKPSIKHIAIVIYLLVGILYALYGWMFGDTAHKSFLYNVGVGLVWPAAMFPVVGKIVGGIVIIALVALVALT